MENSSVDEKTLRKRKLEKETKLQQLQNLKKVRDDMSELKLVALSSISGDSSCSEKKVGGSNLSAPPPSPNSEKAESLEPDDLIDECSSDRR